MGKCIKREEWFSEQISQFITSEKKTGNILDYATERSEFTGVESVGFINLRYVWDGKFAIISQPCN